jgi:putative ABC transport system substrate-binding protein
VASLWRALRELGYLEGRNLVIERRYAEGKLDRLPALARELVAARLEAAVAAALGGPASENSRLCRKARARDAAIAAGGC